MRPRRGSAEGCCGPGLEVEGEWFPAAMSMMLDTELVMKAKAWTS